MLFCNINISFFCSLNFLEESVISTHFFLGLHIAWSNKPNFTKDVDFLVFTVTRTHVLDMFLSHCFKHAQGTQ